MSVRNSRLVFPAGEAKSISLCADDFGMNPAINDGILELAEKGRLSATSCMSRGKAFRWSAGALSRAPLAAGLHLNFTEASEAGAFHLPLPRLILSCYSGLIGRENFRCEINRQLDCFEDAVGRPPSYVDGHQHVHQFPIIRECLLDILLERYPGRLPWLRSTVSRIARPSNIQGAFKSRVIERLGAHALRRLTRQHGFAMNPGFLGIYGFDLAVGDYLALMGAWIQAAAPGDLIMCHPAKGIDPTDSLASQRAIEFSVLQSGEFQEMLDCLGASVTLEPKPIEYQKQVR